MDAQARDVIGRDDHVRERNDVARPRRLQGAVFMCQGLAADQHVVVEKNERSGDRRAEPVVTAHVRQYVRWLGEK